MSYTIKVHQSVYWEWKSFVEWDAARCVYNLHLKQCYAGFISCLFCDGDSRTFEFESEQHYHWFLLQQ